MGHNSFYHRGEPTSLDCQVMEAATKAVAAAAIGRVVEAESATAVTVAVAVAAAATAKTAVAVASMRRAVIPAAFETI